MKFNTLKQRKVLILGFGREGKSSLKFLRKMFPKKVFGIADQNENVKQILNIKKIKWHLGKDYLRSIKNYDIIIKTPGISPKILRPYFKKGEKITSQTEIFFENCPGKIIGVTGTKGKSTTSTLIYKILKAGKIKVHLIGNIGKPALSHLSSATKNDIYVYELSSHQLMNLKHSPHIAVFLNIYPEHGDYYRNFNQYLKAKQNICRWQKKEDYFIYNSGNKFVKETAKLTKAKKIPIKGRYHNLNIAAARAVGKIFGIPGKKIEKVIKNFKGLPHRLEFVGEFSGIKFYNDSLATIPESTIEAINTLGKNLQTIILGGFDRGQDFKKLAKRILESKIETLILFPTTGERIWKEIKKQRGRVSLRNFRTVDMKEAVKLSYQYTKKGKICLLSPASASFNLFKNYKERGDLFKKFIKKLAKNER